MACCAPDTPPAPPPALPPLDPRRPPRPLDLQLEAVVRRLLWLTRQDATNRVLLFSSWKDVLELVR